MYRTVSGEPLASQFMSSLLFCLWWSISVIVRSFQNFVPPSLPYFLPSFVPCIGSSSKSFPVIWSRHTDPIIPHSILHFQWMPPQSQWSIVSPTDISYFFASKSRFFTIHSFIRSSILYVFNNCLLFVSCSLIRCIIFPMPCPVLSCPVLSCLVLSCLVQHFISRSSLRENIK